MRYEERLIRLAEAATPGQRTDVTVEGYGKVVVLTKDGAFDMTEEDATFITALSPSTVILLARVVEAARVVRKWAEHMAECDVCHFVVRPPVPDDLKGFPTEYCENGKALDFNLFRDVLPLVGALDALDDSQENRP